MEINNGTMGNKNENMEVSQENMEINGEADLTQYEIISRMWMRQTEEKMRRNRSPTSQTVTHPRRITPLECSVCDSRLNCK